MPELMANLPIWLALAGSGVIAGIMAGLFGVGGGIVIVPVLYFLLPGFGVEPDSAMSIATATSLAIIVPTAISSVRAHWHKGNVDGTILKLWAGFILLAAVSGSLLANELDGDALTILFGFIAILVGLNMLFRSNAKAIFQQLPGKLFQAILASLVGGLSVMIGIGGGTLGVPLLSAFNVPTHRAVGTSAAFGLLIASAGVVTLLIAGETPEDAPFATYGLFNLPAFIAIVPLTVLCAPLGVKIGAKLSQQQLKKAFAIVLLFTGTRMLYQVFGGSHLV